MPPISSPGLHCTNRVDGCPEMAKYLVTNEEGRAKISNTKRRRNGSDENEYACGPCGEKWLRNNTCALVPLPGFELPSPSLTLSTLVDRPVGRARRSNVFDAPSQPDPVVQLAAFHDGTPDVSNFVSEMTVPGTVLSDITVVTDQDTMQWRVDGRVASASGFIIRVYRA